MARFTKRLVEQTLVAAGAAFLGVLVTSGGEWNKAAVGLALGAAVRAAYGILVKPVGNVDEPNAVK